MTIKSSFRFEGINKVYSDFSLWQILSFVGPWNTIVEAAVEVRSIKNTACVENNGVGENILEHNLLSAKKCGKAPKSVWKSQIFKEQSNSSHHCCPYYYNDIDVYHLQQGTQKCAPFWFIHILSCRFNPIRSQLETVLDFWLVNVYMKECELIKESLSHFWAPCCNIIIKIIIIF